MPKNAAKREYYPVTDNDTMIVNIQKDKEQPVVLIHLYMKRDATPDSEKQDERYLRDDYVDGLVSSMLNSRYTELRQQANPPFMSVSGRAGSFFISRTKEAFSMAVSCKQENILGGLMSAMAATERARQHGFTQSELDRAKKLYMAGADRRYEGRNDRRNSHYVNQCIQHFLANEPMLSAEQNLELTKKFDREVTLDEVNRAVRKLITNKNQVVVVYAPDKEGVVLPSEKDIEQVVLTMQQQEYMPYVEEQLAEHLISQLPKPGSIVSEKPYKHGFTELTLSNGMKVYVKKTDFVADGVQMKIHGEGGLSLYGDEDIPNFSLVSSAISEAGIGDFDATTLRKMLTGKSIRYGASVGQRGQSFSATGSVKNIQTMMELAYLYFTQPRRDTVAFAGLMNRTRSFLANRNASPKVDYNDSIAAIMYGNHPRTRPVTREVVDKASYDRILQIYKERFADASNFKTVIVGNVNMDELRQQLCQYLASLPATHKGEQTNWKNIAQVVEGSSVHKFSKKMATPLANVTIFYSADVPFTAQSDLELDFLKRVLQVAYTDSVREEKGGTYGVGVSFDLDKDDKPNATLKIAYNADPSRYDELNPIIYKQLEHIAQHGPAESSMQKIKQYLVKQYQQVAITNDYWDYVIWHELDDDTDFDTDYCKMVEAMKPEQVQRMAQRMLEAKRCIEVTMLSEKE
jgi:zinc protease